jgi:ADP-heptose:LPS heptosyltransferase
MKILVIRFGAIGDLVLVEPILQLLHQSGHEVHLLTKNFHAPMFELHPSVKLVHVWESPSVLSELRNLGFDAILDAHNNVRSRWVSLCLWPASVYRMPKEAWRKLPLPLRFQSVTPVKERLLKAAEPLLVTNTENVQGWQGLPGVVKPNPYRVWVLGATYHTKQVPSDIATAILNQVGGSWVLLGAASDKAKADEITKGLQPHVEVEVCCSQGLAMSAVLLSGARQVVSGDTGMAHWAAALRVPLHVIWGNTSPQYGLAPGQWGGSKVEHHQVNDLSCRPCSKFGFSECPKGHFHCMRNQNLESIAAAIKNLD